MNTTTTPPKKEFTGDKKNLVHFLVPYEQKFLDAAVPHVPAYIGTTHLTLMTILWSGIIIMAGYLAQANVHWLWLLNTCIVLQYMTDMLDGAVGRARNTGLVKWGFYMDHFLDYVFLSSIIVGYSFMLPQSYLFLSLLCLAFCVGFMVHVFLDFSVTNNFKISCNYFGVSELRLVLIVFNVGLIVLGKGLLIQVFPFFVGGAFLALCVLVYRSQKVYNHLDAIYQATQAKDTQKKRCL